MRRTQRYGLFLASWFAASFFQGAVFLAGDSCHHEPKPSVCQPSNSYVVFDWGRILLTFWSLVFCAPLIFVVRLLLHKAQPDRILTSSERRARIRRWWWMERAGNISLFTLHLSFWLFFFRFVQFYGEPVLWRWFHGSVLALASECAASPLVRSLQFIHMRLQILSQS